MTKLIVGNWKMNGLTGEATALAEALRDGIQATSPECDLVVCPPLLQISNVRRILHGTRVAVGGQDCHWQSHGAFTGSTSASMLRDSGAEWVIIGHSERRQGDGEADSVIRKKIRAALEAGLVPILCVGETAEERSSQRAMEIVRGQLMDGLTKDFSGVVAYEPVWAIGTGHVCGEADAVAMHHFMRRVLCQKFGSQRADAIRLLYGGSMKPSNAGPLLALPNVDGGLIGTASLKADDFLAIAHVSPAQASAGPKTSTNSSPPSDAGTRVKIHY